MIHDLLAYSVKLVELAARYRIPLLFLSCIGLGAAGAWFIASMPFRTHLLDTPNRRSSHTIPTPRGGGVGILVAFILAGLTLRIPTTFLFAAILISSVSFYGDYFRLSVKFRLAIQFLSTLILLFPLVPRLTGHFAISTLGLPVFVFPLLLLGVFIFIVGTANFYNFMDGINGIAGLSGVIGFGLLGLYTFHRPPPDAFQIPLSLLSLGIALACLGYLPFNMPRARVFMGDVGSVLLGFIFAGLVVTLSRNYLEIVCFTALFFPFYADELTTMAVRLRNRENLVQSHRRHLYQLLVNECDIAHWKVSAYGTLQLAIGTGVLMACPHGAKVVLLFLTACFLCFTLLTIHIRKHVKRSRAPLTLS